MTTAEDSVTVKLPITTKKRANRRRHWALHHRRIADQRHATAVLLLNYAGKCKKTPERITLVRIAPRDLDDDNLVSALKAIRDGIQDWAGIDDRKLKCSYEQRRGGKNEYAVEITLHGVK